LTFYKQKVKYESLGAMAELADATDLKSVGGNTVWVRPPLALQHEKLLEFSRSFYYGCIFLHFFLSPGYQDFIPGHPRRIVNRIDLHVLNASLHSPQISCYTELLGNIIVLLNEYGGTNMSIVERLINKKSDNQNHTVEKTDSVLEALKVMAGANISAVMVTDKDKIIGIFTERDYSRKGEIKGLSAEDTPVEELMTASMMTVTEDTSLNQCMELMRKYKIRHLPVLDNDKMIGMVSMRDVVETIVSDQESMIIGLENYILGSGFSS
jgi:predicted transcriptional regulator